MNMKNEWEKANSDYFAKFQHYDIASIELKQISLFDYVPEEKYNEDWFLSEIL